MSQKNDAYVSRSVRTIAILTLITSVVWTALSIYSALNTPPDVDVTPEILKPVDPSLDTDTLTLLSQKRQLTHDTQAVELLRQTLELSATQAEKAGINQVDIPVSQPTSSVSGDNAL